jgi:hypothetical protein
VRFTFGKEMILYQPIKERLPFFQGWDTKSAVFDTGCPHCKERLQVKFKEMLDAAWGWQDRMDEELRDPLAKIFEINLSNRSIAMGMPGVVSRTCTSCHISSYFYFHFNETSNSVYSISLRAAATEEPNPKAEQGGDGDAVEAV